MKAQSLLPTHPTHWPIWQLLHPRERAPLLLLASILALAAWGVAVWQAGMPIWGATTLALAFLGVPVALKWRDDWLRYGPVMTMLSVMLIMQSFHTVEHVVQAIQFYLLSWSPFRSSGLISSLNAEWVHFTWNWLVVAGVVYLFKHGMRNKWAWLLLIWAVAHSLEHTYLFIRYWQVKQALLEFGLSELAAAQALPGILGRDGWIAQNFYCNLPGITTGSRISIHFWWNMGEIVLLLLAGHYFLKKNIVEPPVFK